LRHWGNQAVARDDAVGIQQQNCKQAPLLRPAHLERPPVIEHFERAEDPKLHPRSILRGLRSVDIERSSGLTEVIPASVVIFAGEKQRFVTVDEHGHVLNS